MEKVKQTSHKGKYTLEFKLEAVRLPLMTTCLKEIQRS
jgi:hypothetical protein